MQRVLGRVRSGGCEGDGSQGAGSPGGVTGSPRQGGHSPRRGVVRSLGKLVARDVPGA